MGSRVEVPCPDVSCLVVGSVIKRIQWEECIHNIMRP
jgi:hypothetical protein